MHFGAPFTSRRLLQLRFTIFATRFALTVEAGVPLAVIQDLAGHASVTMTRRYTHPGNEVKQTAVELLLSGQQNTEPLQNPLHKRFDTAERPIG